MPRFLSAGDARTIEKMLDELMDDMGPDDPMYDRLFKAYNSFEVESNSAAVIARIEALVRLVDTGRADLLLSFLCEKIRQTNYPSAWNQASLQARDHYRQAHPALLTPGLYWLCPGHGVAAHDVGYNEVTIDHIQPVAWHWNATGHDTDRVTRQNWYWHMPNHAYLCRSCNSRRGSGGLLYSIAVGHNYSN